MAEAIGIAAGIVGLVTFAFQSSRILFDTVSSYENLPKSIEDLKNEIESLSDVLDSLKKTIQSSNMNFDALDFPLRQCGKACHDFRTLITKNCKHTTDTKRSIRDWARLRYLDDGVLGFQNMLAGYKATIIIALSNANIRKVNVTAQLLQEYKDMIDDTIMKLEMHLQAISDKLDRRPQGSQESPGSKDTEWQVMEDEKESTEKSLQICADFLDYIERVRDKVAKGISPASDPDQVHVAVTSNRVTAKRVMFHTFDDLRLRLDSTKALLEKFSHIPPSSSSSEQDGKLPPKQQAERRELEEAFAGLSKSLEFCTDVSELDHSDRVHSFDRVSMKDDGVQVIVATMGDLLRVSYVEAGSGSTQIFGQMKDETVQECMRNKADRNKEMVSKGGDGPIRESEPRWNERFGAGVRLDARDSATEGAKRY